MKTLAIVIPVYNEEENIKKVIVDWSKILSTRLFDIIVVNDGSKDKTKLILNKIKKKIRNLKVINKPNGGHGETIYLGYKYAVEKKYKFIFQVDSDDQFSAKDFKSLWKLRNKPFDLVMGYRLHRKDPLIRIFLSKVVLRIFFLIYFNKTIADANIPYRLMKYNFLDKFIQNSSKKYIAPNILMTLYAEKIISTNVRHFQRSKGVIRWPIKRLIYFGVRLIIEITEWKRTIS